MAEEAKKPEVESEAEKLGRKIGGLFGKLRVKVKAVIDDPDAAIAAAKAKVVEIGEKIEKGVEEIDKDPKASLKSAVNKAAALADKGVEYVAGAVNKVLPDEKTEEPKDKTPKGPVPPAA